MQFAKLAGVREPGVKSYPGLGVRQWWQYE